MQVNRKVYFIHKKDSLEKVTSNALDVGFNKQVLQNNIDKKN